AKRDETVQLVVKADAADQRGYMLEKKLDAINSSEAGVFLNVGGNRLAYMLLDIMLHVRPALGARLTAARNLSKRYDNVIASAETTLARYDTFNDWASFYRWQDWARDQFQSSAPCRGHLASEELRKQQASRDEILIRELTDQTVANSNATKDR